MLSDLSECGKVYLDQHRDDHEPDQHRYRQIDAGAVAVANPTLVIFDPNRHLRDFSPVFAERYIAVGSPRQDEARP